MFCITFSVTHNGVSVIITRVIITVKDKPWISLVKLVVSITYPLFLAKREILLNSLFLEGRYFGGHYFWHLLTPAKFLSTFGGLFLSGGGVSLLSKLYGKQNYILEIKFIYLGT